MKKIALIACCSTKLDTSIAVPYSQLYVSPLFKLSVDYANRHFDRYYILSAKSGLVHPDWTSLPYDYTLLGKDVDVVKRWSLGVMQRLNFYVGNKNFVYVLAGSTYTKFLLPLMKESGYEVYDVLKGMRVGKRLRWLKNN